MKEINAKGLPCPQPVIKTKEALESLKEGEKLKVIVDNETALKNVQKFATSQGHKILSIEKINSDFFIIIEKRTEKGEEITVTCEIDTKKERGLFVIVATDTMGKDESLGKILMKAYFETMLAHNLFPNRIFFMNRGVFLTTQDEEIIPLLKDLEKKGVEIFSCGTCLKYYNLEDRLKVGYRAGTDVYLEGIFYFKKTIWIG
ncbi:MAG: sulfurtransferase-like selenium metabolism protein YedF [Thermodesulfobacterium geofontis]|uniref:Sulfurtransferase-like selenium metabolism protein YedF n=1 Tax=Thermodesulfobacterium geofontis TaxID=1295609 RepID=A0A2N7QFU6_9BACT|nr:MAG: sulfurtransferase-like selenium metabolism protein YedF [Thermodesulfobacterium geofontis]PMP97828.1 MAG: sulfurtransferase-like selenium metabolism protein YedF [Thermodesulfobacterium geofontis]